MTHEELFHSLCSHLRALSTSQRAIVERPELGANPAAGAVIIVLDVMDKFVQDHKDKEKKMLEEMAEHYEEHPSTGE